MAQNKLLNSEHPALPCCSSCDRFQIRARAETVPMSAEVLHPLPPSLCHFLQCCVATQRAVTVAVLQQGAADGAKAQALHLATGSFWLPQKDKASPRRN